MHRGYSTVSKRIRYDCSTAMRWAMLLYVCLTWPLPLGAAAAASAGSCLVSDWGPFTPCTRTAVSQWSSSRARTVLQPGTNCPGLTETRPCEAPHSSQPPSAAESAQQALTGVLVNLPLSLSVGITHPESAPNSTAGLQPISADLAAALATGRQLWRQQASAQDLLQCSPFNGPAQLLSDAAAAPVTGTKASSPGPDSLTVARSAVSAAAKALAYQAAAAVKGTALPSRQGERLKQAVLSSRGLSAPAAGGGGRQVLPPPAADAAADVQWDGRSALTATITPGAGMSPTALYAALSAFQDGMTNSVSWLRLKTLLSAQQQQAGREEPARGVTLNMTYDHSQQAATWNSVGSPTNSSHSQLLLSIVPYMTGIYGLNLSSSAAKEAVMRIPSTDAVVVTNAGGGVLQLGLSLTGTWTQANLTAALGLQMAAQAPSGTPQQQQQPHDAFTIAEPALLFSAAPSALYVAVATSVSSLGVEDAPATINIRPGGAAALTLFEPCQPVSGLQLSDVQLQLQPGGDLAGVASGTLASTAVSALATVTAAQQKAAADTDINQDPATPGQDLQLVMTADTVGAGKLADVITIITRRPPPSLLRLLREQPLQQQQPPQQPMQFSSVTLTYSSAGIRRRRREAPREGDDEDSGFSMVAVPDVNAAPALKQMLDAVGLNHDSLTLRASGDAAVGSAFTLAANEPFRLPLPAPFTGTGPTVLTLQVVQHNTTRAGPADTLVTTELKGTATAGLQLPGVTGSTSLDLSSVVVSTPTAIIGADATRSGDLPVHGQLRGKTLSPVVLKGLGFMKFGTLAASVRAGFQPLSLKELDISGAVTAFGASGNATFSLSSGVTAQQAGVSSIGLSARLPNISLPLLAQAIGANMNVGALSADLHAANMQLSAPAERALTRAGAQQEPEAPSLKVAGELRLLGMTTNVSFDVSGQQGAAVAAVFSEGHVNKALLPNLLSAVVATMRATQQTIKAALGSTPNRQAMLQSLIDDTKAGVSQAKKLSDDAAAAFNAVKLQAASALQQGVSAANAATSALTSFYSVAGAELEAARSQFNAADMAFSQAKTAAYKELNTAQQAYKDALAAHEKAVGAAQERVDTLVSQVLELRAAYNTANMLCTPSATGLELCKAAAGAWVHYRTAAAALEDAETSLHQVATAGTTAAALRAAKAAFSAAHAAAADVASGKEWAARATAEGRLQAAAAALHGIQTSREARDVQAANVALVQAQDGLRAVLSSSGEELGALTTARGNLRAARAALRAATAAARLSVEELEAASKGIDSLLAQLQAQATALTQNQTAGAADTQPLRFDRISIMLNLVPDSAPVLAAVSLNGMVTLGEQQKALTGRFSVDVSSEGDELGLLLHEVLRDECLTAFKALVTPLAPVL